MFGSLCNQVYVYMYFVKKIAYFVKNCIQFLYFITVFFFFIFSTISKLFWNFHSNQKTDFSFQFGQIREKFMFTFVVFGIFYILKKHIPLRIVANSCISQPFLGYFQPFQRYFGISIWFIDTGGWGVPTNSQNLFFNNQEKHLAQHADDYYAQ